MPNDRVPKHKQRLADVKQKLSNPEAPVDPKKAAQNLQQKPLPSPAGAIEKEGPDRTGAENRDAAGKKEEK